MNLHPSFLSAINLIGLPSESHAFSASFLDFPYGDPAAHSPASSSTSGTSLSYAYSTSEPGGASQDIDPEGAEPDILVDQPDTFGSIGSYHTRESYEEGGKMGILEQGGESEGRPGAQEQTRSDRKLLCRFIAKLKYLLDNPALFGTYIHWSDSGTRFIVAHKDPRLPAQVLDVAFGQDAKVASFVRQLNGYGFIRMARRDVAAMLDPSLHADDYQGWTHGIFSRHSTLTELATIKPKQAKAKLRRAQAQEKKDRAKVENRKVGPH